MIELNELRDAAQKAFPADQLVPERDKSWELAAEMGWLMIRVPEELGGLGLGADASTTIHYEMGRVLSSVPLIPAQLGIQALVEATELEGKEDWIERACSGEYIPLHQLPSAVTEDGGKLTGTISGFFEADMASHVVVGMADRYILVSTDAPGVTVTERQIWDRSRRLFDVELDGYAPDPALTLATGDAVRAMHDTISPESQLAVMADCLGGATAALDMTVEYLTMRKQFERPLAMFQALKHRCADLKTQIVATEALMWSRAVDPEASITDYGAAKILAAETYRFVTEEAIQLHGGIGLTEEHQCHLVMKRAMLNLQLSGGADHWKEQAGRQALEQFAAA